MTLFNTRSFKSVMAKTTRTASSIGAIGTLALAGGLVGCTTTSNISPQYVAPSAYSAYNCIDLSQELGRIDNYIAKARSQQSTFSASGVGVGISAGRWGISPNITFGVGKSNNTRVRDANLSRLYGERDAVIQSARLKRCGFAQGLKIYGE